MLRAVLASTGADDDAVQFNRVRGRMLRAAAKVSRFIDVTCTSAADAALMCRMLCGVNLDYLPLDIHYGNGTSRTG